MLNILVAFSSGFALAFVLALQACPLVLDADGVAL